jgi:hypothetical protein
MTNIKQTNFQELFVNLLSKLSEREQDVLKNRYHLTSDLPKKATLKQIGDTYNITRERVRQIEKEAIRKLVEQAGDSEFSTDLTQIENEYINYLEKNGGVVREDHLLENFVSTEHDLDFLHSNAFLFALGNLFNSTEKVDNHDSFHNVWKLGDVDLDHIAELITKLEAVLVKEEKVYERAQMLELAKSNLTEQLEASLQKYTSKHGLDINDFLGSYLHSTSKIESNILDEWGLSHWDSIKPKKLGDKINLVFRKITKPLHFREIADKINESKFDHKNICAATVHNELIANDNFVLIGRGLYALKDWGYSTGTVADIIKGILEKANKPMTKDEIYEEVLKQRLVNKSTIYLTLINKNKFDKTSEGRFDILR